MSKLNRNNDAKREAEAQPELESQFILRVPSEPAKILRDLIQSGANNLKDRLTIRIENDMRTGEVRLDHMLLHAKVMDLPTIIESLKTIDNKTFYKTADICQIVICKEDDDQVTTDEETPSKNKKKDPNKVDKKFLYPHGITPPLKNVRKKRFRKTLKKKFVEAPEIEKEVKRLLRVDNEAVNVKWEVINEDEDKGKISGVKEEGRPPGKIKSEKTGEASGGGDRQGVDVAEQDIFGGAVSDSDEEGNINVMEMEDTSRLSADSSRMSDSASRGPGPLSSGARSSSAGSQRLVTEFSKEMFSPSRALKQGDHYDYGQSSRMFDDMKSDVFNTGKTGQDYESPTGNAARERYKERMVVLEKELEDLKTRRQQQEQEVANIENMALRQRFQDILDNLLTDQMQKEQEYNEVRRSWERSLRDA